jgi:hypothetical protein
LKSVVKFNLDYGGKVSNRIAGGWAVIGLNQIY